MIGFKKSGIMCLAASVVLGGVLAGCSGSSGGGTDILIPFTTQASFSSGTSHENLAASSSDQVVTATVVSDDSSVSGGTADVLVPAGETVLADTPVGLFSGEQELFADTTVEGGRAPGDITLNGNVLTKAYIDKNGRLHIVGSDTSKRPAFIALPRSKTWTLSITGPLTVQAQNADLSRSKLTIAKVSLYFYTDSAGNIHLPHKLTGHIPANGTQTPLNWIISGTYGTPSDNDGARLTITHANGTMDRTTSVLSEAATFNNSQAGSNDLIPNTGVSEVHYGQAAPGLTVP